MIRCYITDRRSCPTDLLDVIERNARNGVDYIQIREKDLSARDLAQLVRAALGRIESTTTKLLVNGRADVALATGAHGVHLPGRSIPLSEWRRILPARLIIGVSCHTREDIVNAQQADYVVFSPVFESPGKGPAAGLDPLSEAARSSTVPVLALGGVTFENAEDCIRAGAAGIAGIRLFQG